MPCPPVIRSQRDTRGRLLRLQVPFPRSSGCTPRSSVRQPPNPFAPRPVFAAVAAAGSVPAVAAPMAAGGHQGRTRRRRWRRRQRPPCKTSVTGPPARTGRTPCRLCGHGTGGYRQSTSARGSPRTGQTSRGPIFWSVVDGRCGTARPTDAAAADVWFVVAIFAFATAVKVDGGGMASSRWWWWWWWYRRRLRRGRTSSVWRWARPFFAPRCRQRSSSRHGRA